MKIIEAYHCDYCKKYSKSKSVMTRHEKTCFHNPVMRACATCENLEQVEFTREMPFVSSRPMCRAGVEISQLNSNSVFGYEVKLQSECEYHKMRELIS